MFHIINRNSPKHFDAVRDLVMSTQGPVRPLIASQNHLDGLPFDKWAQNFGVLHFETAVDRTGTIHGALKELEGHNPPHIAMVDEVRSESVDMNAKFAKMMREQHPEQAGRWGCYVASGPRINLSNYAPAIDELLKANAHIAVEMYPRYADYCRAAKTTAGRDAWLTKFFIGGAPFPKNRFKWLMQRRAQLDSQSHVTVLFGVTDKGKAPGKLDYLKGSHPAVFLDRLFFVWVTRTGFPSIISAENGGAGSYKWDKEAVSNTTRGKAFVESWRHYCQEHKTTSRLGPVRCG
jgi:hypothetical protein